MQYLFMNHRIREKVVSGPVIICQNDDGEQRESNCFEIVAFGQPIGRIVFKSEGLKQCDTHEVRAWVELDDDIELVDVTAKAKAKKPNKKIR